MRFDLCRNLQSRYTMFCGETRSLRRGDPGPMLALYFQILTTDKQNRSARGTTAMTGIRHANIGM